MPYDGETRQAGGKTQRYSEKAHGWIVEEGSGSGVSLSSEPAKPKVQTKGASGLAETQSKSLSQILKEREEKRQKAEIIRSGGSK